MFFLVVIIFNSSERGRGNIKYKLQQVALFEGLQVVLHMSKNRSLKASEKAGAYKEQTTFYLFKTGKMT
jgi:hypothetical protein